MPQPEERCRREVNRRRIGGMSQPPNKPHAINEAFSKMDTNIGKPSTKFKLRQRVKKIGTQEVRTVEEIRTGDGEPLYSIQLGSDFATRIWARESELESAG
jgi:hypothetical protein